MCIPTETSELKNRIRQVQAASNGAGRSRRVLAGSGGLGSNVNAPKQTHGVGHLDQTQRRPEQDSAGSGGFRGRRQVPAGSNRFRWICVHRQGAEEGTWRETSRLKSAVSRALPGHIRRPEHRSLHWWRTHAEAHRCSIVSGFGDGVRGYRAAMAGAMSRMLKL